MIEGVASRAFSASTLPPFPKPAKSHKEKIIKVSQEQYGTKREIVEEEIAKWSEAVVLSAMAKDKPYEAVCSTCGKKTRVSFKPDGVRPVYCPICLEKAREERAKEMEASETPKEELESPKKKRKEVDIKGLREVLSETLKKEE